MKEKTKQKWLGPQKGYVEMLDEALIAADKEDQLRMRKEKNPLRPSSAGKCARALVHELREHLGLEEVTVENRSGAAVRIFDLGHHIETHILRLFRKVDGVNANVYNQQVVGVVDYDDGTFTEGSIDMGLRAEGCSLGIGDAKSKKDKFSASHKSAWDEQAEAYAGFQSVTKVSDSFFWIDDLDMFLVELKDAWFRANFFQLNAYIHSDFMQKRKVDHGSIIQYNKNDSRMREFRFRPSQNAYQYVVDKFRLVKNNAETPENVPKEHTLGSVVCAFCPHNKKCWPDADAKQEYFKTFPAKQWPTDTHSLGSKVAAKLEALYDEYREASSVAGLADEAADEICAILNEKKVRKIRFSDGAIYELKLLKSPRPHFKLRRSKL